MNPRVSIILPVYNGADCVSNSIDSVLAQEYKDFELIAVNDCSTDNTWDILQEYAKKDSRVKAYSNEENKKLPRTLNTGFSHACGEYLTWTSDDNMYEPQAIGEMVKYLDEHPECGLVYADQTIINELGEEAFENVRVAAKPKDIRLRSVCGACFMYRASVAKKVGEYNPDYFLAEDFDYWIRISEASSIEPLHKNLYKYRLQPNSLTGSLKWERIKAQKLKVLEAHFDYLYSLCENEEDKIAFFNNYIKCTSDEDKPLKLEKVYTLMPEYKKVHQKNEFNDWKYSMKKKMHLAK